MILPFKEHSSWIFYFAGSSGGAESFAPRATYFLLMQKVGKDTFRGEVPKSFFFVFAEKSAMISVRPADAPLG